MPAPSHFSPALQSDMQTPVKPLPPPLQDSHFSSSLQLASELQGEVVHEPREVHVYPDLQVDLQTP